MLGMLGQMNVFSYVQCVKETQNTQYFLNTMMHEQQISYVEVDCGLVDWLHAEQ